VICVGGFNTAVDKWMEADAIQIGGVTRVRGVRALPGGKGLHVAVAAAALGEAVHLVGLSDLRNDGRLRGFLRERGVEFDSIAVDAELRTCLAIKDADGRVSELLEPGPEVAPAVREQLIERFCARARGASVCVLSGSLPPGFPDTGYAELIQRVSRDGAACLLDASGELLRAGIAARPAAVKPNREEAAALHAKPIADVAAAAEAADAIAARGVRIVVISLGSEGAVASVDGRRLHAVPPALAAQNTVGAGDCLMAGLAVGLSRGLNPEEALRVAVACGAAKVVTPESGFLRRADVDALLPRIDVRSLA
jgi:tagatose 6-phosphate kinase